MTTLPHSVWHALNPTSVPAEEITTTQFKCQAADVTTLPLPSSLTEADLFMRRAIFQHIQMLPPLDDDTSRSYPASDNSNAKQLDVTPLPLPSSLTEADLFMPRAIFQNKNKSHHHSMTTQADVTLPIDKSNAKQLDVTPLPLPSSLTEAELFKSRAIFQNISFA